MRLKILALMFLLVLSSMACSKPARPPDSAGGEEAIARTEFTDRIENFFEYEPLKVGKTSQFLIHLTDLSDGTPVAQAEVTLSVRDRLGESSRQVRARVGKVTGIYVAELNIDRAGNYDIEFHIKNNKFDERLPLTDFKVE